MRIRLVSLLFTALLAQTAQAANEPKIEREALVSADYRQGMVAFQQRCSACHSSADGGLDLAGPNLHGVFKRKVGTKPGFAYSDALKDAGFQWTPEKLAAWLADPNGYLPGNRMGLPEAVPAGDRVALIAYVMQESGAADWPKPAMPAAAGSGVRAVGAPRDPSAVADEDLAKRFPAFWNHLMTNTTRYTLKNGKDEYKFDAYFEKDGSVEANNEKIKGFWHADERDMFCYALYNLPVAPTQFVECFPIVAMSIPRFREELWTSEPVKGVKLTGGIIEGRPLGTEADAGYWKNLYENTMRYEVVVAGEKQVIDMWFNADKSVKTNSAAAGTWEIVKGGGEEAMCYSVKNVKGLDGELAECFPLRLMYNPRIGARWPSKFKNGMDYWCTVVAGRENAKKPI